MTFTSIFTCRDCGYEKRTDSPSLHHTRSLMCPICDNVAYRPECLLAFYCDGDLNVQPGLKITDDNDNRVGSVLFVNKYKRETIITCSVDKGVTKLNLRFPAVLDQVDIQFITGNEHDEDN